MKSKSKSKSKTKTKSIRQVVNFRGATPEQIYALLMDSKKHAEFTGESAKISKRPGGRFTAYGGYCSGQNLQLKENKKIVQTWRASEWEVGHYSKVTYLLAPTKTGTRITFSQTGVPVDAFKDMKSGWVDFYWRPMQAALDSRKSG